MYKWLEWSEDANAVFCHQCRQTYIREFQISTSTCKLELGFLVNGINFWKNAIVKFDAHQATHYHKHSKTVLTALIVGENVMNRVDEHSSSKKCYKYSMSSEDISYVTIPSKPITAY